MLSPGEGLDSVYKRNRAMSAQTQLKISTHPQQKQRAIVAISCIVFFAAAIVLMPGQPLTGNDSPSYLEFWSQRTAGYPMFLKAVALFDKQLRFLPLVQLLMLCGATFVFSRGLGSVTGRLWCAIAAVLLLLGNYEVVKFSFWVLSDGLFISLLTALLGTLAFWLATKRSVWLAIASMCVGAAISVRPNGFTLLIMLPILYVYAWSAFAMRVRTLAFMAAPAAVVIFFSLAAYHHWHGSWSPNSVLGLNLLGKVAPLADGNEASARPAWIAAVAKVGAVYQTKFAIGETWSDRTLLTAARYDNVRHGLGLHLGDETLFPPDELGTGSAADDALTALALDIIRAHKLAYLRQTLNDYIGLWYIPQILTRDDAARLERVIATQVSSSDLADEISSIPAPRPWPVVMFTHTFQVCIFAISLMFLVLLPVQLIVRRRAAVIIWFGCAAAAALHASILIVATINESKPRFSLDTWPLEVLLAVLALAYASNVIVELFPRSTRN
jgi:hypothetical protein